MALALAQLSVDGPDLPDDHSGHLGRSQRGDARHLDASVDEAIGRLGRDQVEVDELANPAIRNLHGARESSRKLFEKAQIVFEEQPDVVDAVPQHGYPLDAHAEGPARDRFRIIADVTQDLRMDHA